MKCKICGRELKNPESIKEGIGPVCKRRQMSKEQLQKRLDEMAEKLSEDIRESFKTALRMYEEYQEQLGSERKSMFREV